MSTACCPRCNAELGADAPQGLCPACLLEQAVLRSDASGDPTETTAQQHRFVPPSIKELVPLVFRNWKSWNFSAKVAWGRSIAFDRKCSTVWLHSRCCRVKSAGTRPSPNALRAKHELWRNFHI